MFLGTLEMLFHSENWELVFIHAEITVLVFGSSESAIVSASAE